MIDFLIAHFSYKILFVWSIFEGEIGLALAGYMVKQARFDLPLVLAITISGAIIGDMSMFIFGRLFKSKAEAILSNYARRMQKVEKWFLRFGSWIIVFERFIYGTHIPALLMLGVSGFGFWKFVLLDIIGVVLWAVTFTTLGYVFGQTVIDMLSFTQRHVTIVLLSGLFFYGIYLLQKEEDA
jgi:membrane protein DedA with SNARE-associated domain